jgi:hypothetical protein
LNEGKDFLLFLYYLIYEKLCKFSYHDGHAVVCIF